MSNLHGDGSCHADNLKFKSGSYSAGDCGDSMRVHAYLYSNLLFWLYEGYPNIVKGGASELKFGEYF